MEMGETNVMEWNEENIVIRIKNLKVWAPEEMSWWRRKITKPKTVILNNVSGSIKEGEFIAVIGPSGAGKTTFLTKLAGKCILPSSGDVTIRGRNVREIKGIAEMVPQIEAFMNSLTVLEHLVFMTEMKLGSSKKSINKLMLNLLIKELKLTSLVNSRIGGLSGGEKRLLSLAGSLLSSPQILICDEPTTGLDSYNASLVIQVLKKISCAGKIVICSVHQPSSDIFNEFSDIMLMTEGRLLFHGSQKECKELFERMNFYCPKSYNPAEFYINTMAKNPYLETHTHKITKSLDQSMKNVEMGSEAISIHPEFNISQRNWFVQVYLLLWRSSLVTSRNMRSHFIQLLLCVAISSTIIGTCYVGISGTTQRGIQDLRGFIWLICSEVCFSLSYNALYIFECDITLFRREVGIYRTSAYFVASFLGMIPRCIIWPISFVAIATIAVELPNYIVTAMEFVVALVVAAVASTAYGLGMGALFVSSGVMSDVMPCADLPLFLMSGVFLRISSLPFWLYPIKYVSHFYYGMDALSNIYWRQIDYIDCPPNSTVKCITDGVSVLIENGYSSNYVLHDSVGLTCVIVLWSFFAYYGLKREEKIGYAY